MDISYILHEIWPHAPSALHQNYVVLGGFIGLFGLVSLFVKEKLYLTESLVATIVGILCGPVGLKIVVPEVWFQKDFYFAMREAARLVISIQVMAAGVSTPGGFLKKNVKSIAMMLGPVMAVMWSISAVCIRYSLGLSWCESLIVAACITPTDPVLAHSVIKGKFAERYIPSRLRNLLAVESGANDGLGFPFMMLPIWVLVTKSTSEALTHWLLHTWLWEICMSIVIGFICGFAARFLLKQSLRRKLIDKESFLVFTIALTLFVSGLVALMASDDLFAVFIAGNVFAWDEKFLETTNDSHISEVIDMLFNITFFVFFGAVIPWRAFVDFSIWRLLLASSLILLFRRLPVIMLMRPWIPTLQSRKEAFFAGWFGPMGVGAIFFAIQARDIFESYPEANISNDFIERIFPIVAFVVLSSILIHGITVPLTNSHLKRRLKCKSRRKDKMAARLRSIGQTSSADPAIVASSCRSAEGLAAMAERDGSGDRDGDEDGDGNEADREGNASTDLHGQEEYIYVTDDEAEFEAGEDSLDSPLSSGPNDVVVMSPEDGVLARRPLPS